MSSTRLLGTARLAMAMHEMCVTQMSTRLLLRRVCMKCGGMAPGGVSTPTFPGLGRFLVHAMYAVLLQHTRTIAGLPRSDPDLIRNGAMDEVAQDHACLP